MRMRYTPRIFLSVDSALLSLEQNIVNRALFKAHLKTKGVHAVSTYGCWANVVEESFMIINVNSNLEVALGAMKDFHQEAILIMDEDGKGTVLFNNGDARIIGTMKVSETRPLHDYTYVYETGQYITFV